MKDPDFELLIASVKQTGRIKRGEIEPARRSEVRAEDGTPVSVKGCSESSATTPTPPGHKCQG